MTLLGIATALGGCAELKGSGKGSETSRKGRGKKAVRRPAWGNPEVIGAVFFDDSLHLLHWMRAAQPNLFLPVTVRACCIGDQMIEWAPPAQSPPTQRAHEVNRVMTCAAQAHMYSTSMLDDIVHVCCMDSGCSPAGLALGRREALPHHELAVALGRPVVHRGDELPTRCWHSITTMPGSSSRVFEGVGISRCCLHANQI